MHSFFLALCLTFQLALGASCTSSLVDPSGAPSCALLEALKSFGISHDGSWNTIQEATEKAWLSHGRNVDLQEISAIPDIDLRKTYTLFTELDMTQTIPPESSCFTYAAVHGSWAQIVRERLWFLKELWDQGVRFSILVFWTGDRILDPHVESEKALLDPSCSPYPFRKEWKWSGALPQNETQMMQLVFDQLDLPEAWRSLPLMIADAPQPAGLNRPHTEHTITAWLALKPLTGSILAISNQPFICRQDAVVRPLLPPPFSMESAGPGFPLQKLEKEKRGTAILLAELAYRIKLYCQSLSSVK